MKTDFNFVDPVYDEIKKYLVFESGEQVRIDRVITINGIPGPAYQEYDSYGLVCLDCR